MSVQHEGKWLSRTVAILSVILICFVYMLQDNGEADSRIQSLEPGDGFVKAVTQS